MSDAEAAFFEVGDSIGDAERSQIFGKKSYKAGSKAFICFFQDCMVFKLSGDQHSAALGLSGSKLFDPSGKGRPMKEWVQVSYDHHDLWPQLGTAANEYACQR